MRWCLLSNNFTKANADGAFAKGSKKASLGVILRDSSGVPIDGACECFDAGSAFMAEACSFR